MDNRQYVENISQLINNQQRTRFPLRGGDSFMTMNKGKLYPVQTFEVLPGDTWNLHIQHLIRATTLIKPIMNNIWLQLQCFFVPNRLTEEHWEEIMGANKQGPWITNKTTYEVSRLIAPEGGFAEKTLADYLGIPTKVSNLEVSALYTKGYCQVWNDWYRDENRQNFTHISMTGNLAGSNGTNYVTDAELGGALLPVAKAHDLFTSSSIEAQKGPDVLLPLGTYAPVNNASENFVENKFSPEWYKSDGTHINSSTKYLLGVNNTANSNTLVSNTSATGEIAVGYLNLQADLGNALSPSVNSVRLAFALQQMYELDALSGTRYKSVA